MQLAISLGLSAKPLHRQAGSRAARQTIEIRCAHSAILLCKRYVAHALTMYALFFRSRYSYY